MISVRALRTLCLALLLAVFAGASIAQVSDPDRDIYAGWQELADETEKALDEPTEPNEVLSEYRKQIAAFRETFAEGRDKNAVRIRTLESQLEALGPKPEEGEEPKDIADLRQTLNAQLDELRVPQVVAEEAFNRANGLISEIDRVVRERQASQLLARGPSPLNPTHWTEAFRELKTAIVADFQNLREAAQAPQTNDVLHDSWPLLLVLSVVGLLLIVMGAHWSERLGNYLRRLGGSRHGVWSFVVSLARIILPYFGVVLICVGLLLTGLGERGAALISAIPRWSFIYLFFRWLGLQVTAEGTFDKLEFRKPYHRTETRLMVGLLGVMIVAQDAISMFQQAVPLSDATRAIIGFPPILISALVLLRIQRISIIQRQLVAEEDEDPANTSGSSRLLAGLRRVITLMALTAPVLAVFGYFNAAEAIIYPAILTLALISAFAILQRFFGNVYGWLSGKGEAAQDSLFTVLVGFGLSLVALPILALIWGARAVDLVEVWERFVAGFTVGGVQISPVSFLTFVVIFAVGYSLTKLVQGALRTNLLPKTSIDAGGQNAIVSFAGYLGVFLAALIAITGAGFDLSSLAIVAGALSVGIGFGLQTIVSNFVSGIILLIERPISKGDWIEVGGLMGYVRDISVRSTRIETFDRTDVIVPNSDLISGTVTNYTRGNTVGRVIVPVGVAYGTDTRRVEKILQQIANAHPMVLANPAPAVVFQGFGADSLDFEIRAILRDVNWVLSVKSDMNHEIAKRFTEEEIEIPFAQRDVWLRNPEVLNPPKPDPA